MFRCPPKTVFPLARFVFLIVILLATIASAQNVPNRLLPVIVDGKHGFISSGGEIAIPARFEFAWGFHEGLASAWMEDRAGFIDESGKFVIPPQFQYARAFENGLADVELSDRWGFINKNGTFVISPRYIQTRSFSGGLAAVQTDNELWGYVDKDGKERIPAQFTLAWDFYEKVAAVYRGDRCGFIDEAGLEVVPFQFSECRGMKHGVGAVRVDKQWGYITAAGDFFITPSFEDAELFFEGLAAVEKNGKWGFIDREGRFVISPQFDYSRAEPTITQFSEGLAGVTKNGKFGYVDKTGAYVIGPTFTKGFEFRDGIAGSVTLRCAATLTGTELAFGQKHLQLLNDPQLLRRAPGGVMNVRDRYDPTVPAYVLRRRRSRNLQPERQPEIRSATTYYQVLGSP
jgi:hypothetical protein